MNLRCCMAGLVLALVGSGFCQATSLAIVNAGFEDPPLALGGSTSNTTPGWTGAPSIGAGNWYGVAHELFAAPEGVNSGYVRLPIAQKLGDVLSSNTQYTLSFWVAGDARPDHNPDAFRVELLASELTELNLTDLSKGTVLAELTGPIVAGQYQQHVLDYTALNGNPFLGQHLAIRLSQIVLLPNPDPLRPSSDYDDIQLTATLVPEPTGLVTVALGATIAIVGRWFRRRG